MKKLFFAFALPLVLVAGICNNSLQAATPAEELTANFQAIIDESVGMLPNFDMEIVFDDYEVTDDRLLTLEAHFSFSPALTGGLTLHDPQLGARENLPTVGGYDNCHGHMWIELADVGPEILQFFMMEREMFEALLGMQVQSLCEAGVEAEASIESWETDDNGMLVSAVATIEVTEVHDSGQRHSSLVVVDFCLEGTTVCLSIGVKVTEGIDLPLDEEAINANAMTVAILEGVRSNDPEAVDLVRNYINLAVMTALMSQGG